MTGSAGPGRDSDGGCSCGQSHTGAAAARTGGVSRRGLLVAAGAGLAAAAVPAWPALARSTTVAEKDLNLDQARRAAGMLAARGVDVRLTRTNDNTVPLGERTAMASRLGAHVFLSIHNNGSTNRSARGSEMYAQVGRGPSIDLAHRLLRAVTARLGTTPRGVFQRSGRDLDYYFVLRHTEMPGVIVESGFLSNPAEAALLASAAGRQRVAEGIAEGVLAHLGPLPVGPSAPPPANLLGRLDVPPTQLSVQADRHNALVTWRPVLAASSYRVFRNGVVIGEVTEPRGVVGLPGVGVHRVEVRAVTRLAGTEVHESASAVANVTVPWIVVLDPGHGGREPGAVGRF